MLRMLLLTGYTPPDNALPNKRMSGLTFSCSTHNILKEKKKKDNSSILLFYILSQTEI